MTQDSTRSSLQLLLNISRELAVTLDLRNVLDRVLLLSTGNLNAERGSLILMDEKRQPIDAAIVVEGQINPHTLQQLIAVLNSGLAGWVVRNGKTALVTDTSQDERWLFRPDDSTDRTGPKSAICVPLWAHERLVGVLTIVHPDVNFFRQEHQELLQSIADMAGIAIRNAQLYEDLQAAHKRYYDLFEDSIDPIVITDLEGCIVEVNRQAEVSLGSRKPDLLMKNIRDLHCLASESTGEHFEKISEDGTVSYVSHIGCAEEKQMPVEVYVSRLNMGEGIRLQWIFRDISERIELDTLRQDMAAMIYHDLRSPLANIISSVEILKSEFTGQENPAIVSLVQVASRSSERMQRLIDSLLDINRLEAGQTLQERKVIDIDRLTSESVEAVRPVLAGRRINITVDVDPFPGVIQGDEDMLRRVLINLLENAAKFSPTDSAVAVYVRRIGEQAEFMIDDSGPGIPEENRSMIFEKFTRIQRSGYPKGFGLGLAFCRLAVQAHGGKIWVESRLEGGSRFVVSLPAADAAQSNPFIS